ncbi:MAG TPA: phosphate ABC transporter permease subunit PstC [Anaerolineales bacterium]|nr:phosphate ABC transporter permease subunit PstC [Anaerolineales bacterium]
MAQQAKTGATSTLLKGNDRISKKTIDLRKRPRKTEGVIQTFLYFCGMLSILTTIGIVLVLTRESVAFFTDQQWEETNKRLASTIGPADTLLLVEGGKDIETGEIIRISDEHMEVVGIGEGQLEVIRGVEGTEPVIHEEGKLMSTAVSVSLLDFFSKTEWNPQIGQFGIWALVNATLITTMIAMLLALPLGLSIAIYLSEYATPRFRSVIKPILEVLAGIPTVVFGYFALTFVTPMLRSVFGADTVEIYNTASAGLVIGVLIIPLVTSMADDALNAVPNALREASYSLGATRLETALKVVVPAAISGIGAAFIIAMSRAIGETMIVAIAAGAGPNFTLNPFQAAETMTGHIVRISGGDLSYDSIDYTSLFAIALMLFLITLLLNIIGQRVIRRYREVYE